MPCDMRNHNMCLFLFYLKVCSNASQNQHSGADALQVAPGHLQDDPNPMGGCGQETCPLLYLSNHHILDPLSSLGPHGSVHSSVQVFKFAGPQALVHWQPALHLL